MDNRELDFLIDDINDNIEAMLSQSNDDTGNEDLPSDMEILVSGIVDIKALNHLFSGNIDKILQKLFDLVLTGDFETVLKNIEPLADSFMTAGITGGKQPFSGKISTSLLNSIQSSMESRKFNTMKSKLRKVLLVSKNLKRNAKNIKDPIEKKKYLDAAYAIHKTVVMASKIYKTRRLVNNRVKRGLNTLVNESHEVVHIERITW